MAKKTDGGRHTKPSRQVPQNETEAAECLKRIGDKERHIRNTIDEYAAKITEIELEATKVLDPLIKDADTELDALCAFASSHRDALLTGGKKSIVFPTGTIGWRLTPLAVTIKNVKAVLTEIKRRRLEKKFIRTREEIDKQSMLMQRNRRTAMRIPGVTIGQREEFFAQPNDMTEEIIKGRKRKKKKGEEEDE